jgi:hypothetical protein
MKDKRCAGVPKLLDKQSPIQGTLCPCPATERNPRVRYTPLATIAFGSLLLLGAPASAQTNNSYSAPTEFMQLFFDFTGSNEPDYPAGAGAQSARHEQLA